MYSSLIILYKQNTIITLYHFFYVLQYYRLYYNKKKNNGILSFISHSELDCLSLKIRDLNYELFKNNMGQGGNYYTGTPSKEWKKFKNGSWLPDCIIKL